MDSLSFVPKSRTLHCSHGNLPYLTFNVEHVTSPPPGIQILIRFIFRSMCVLKPIDGDARGQKCRRYSSDCIYSWYELHRHPPPAYHTTRVCVLAGPVLVVLIMISGCNSARNHQGTQKNKIGYRSLEGTWNTQGPHRRSGEERKEGSTNLELCVYQGSRMGYLGCCGFALYW